MITLPSPPRRAWLISFWLAISLWGGFLVGLFFALLISFPWFGVGLLFALACACPGLLWPQAVAKPYQAWNRLARYFGRAAHLVLMGICFYILFVIVGRTGSALQLARPPATSSLWVPRGTLAPSAYVSQHGSADGLSLQRGWIANFRAWAAQSGNLWALALLPFFILLSALQSDQQKTAFPANIYTLF